jgi:hypothetical protein
MGTRSRFAVSKDTFKGFSKGGDKTEAMPASDDRDIEIVEDGGELRATVQ